METQTTKTFATSQFVAPQTFSHLSWETMQRQQRDRQVVDLIVKQLQFSREQVPFFGKFYARVRVGDLTDLDDCALHIPALHKEHIRSLSSPYDLLPAITRQNMHRLFLHRGTGGTTGPPTSVFFTAGDFNATMDGNARPYAHLRPTEKPFIAFNGYNQGHISGPYFDSVVRRLGAATVSRNFGSTDEQAVRQLALHEANLIIAPAVSTHKGGAFEHLLEVDTRIGLNYINGDNVDTLLCSSTGITPELYDELKDLGINNCVNMYGSTDVGAIANSPSSNPFELRINFGHCSAHVIDDQGVQVGDSQRGMLIASRIGSYDETGNIIPNQGTQLLNFHLGDEVTFHKHASDEQITLPWISGVKRVMHKKEKLEGGCQVW